VTDLVWIRVMIMKGIMEGRFSYGRNDKVICMLGVGGLRNGV
jgi:hypothetical protein